MIQHLGTRRFCTWTKPDRKQEQTGVPKSQEGSKPGAGCSGMYEGQINPSRKKSTRMEKHERQTNCQNSTRHCFRFHRFKLCCRIMTRCKIWIYALRWFQTLAFNASCCPLKDPPRVVLQANMNAPMQKDIRLCKFIIDNDLTHKYKLHINVSFIR
jgi:hypothetical protein